MIRYASFCKRSKLLWMRFWRLGLLQAAFGVVCAMGHASGQSLPSKPETRKTVFFSIPAQGLHTALDAFRRQSMAEIAYDAQSLTGLWTGPVSGNYDPRTALALMLRNTGYTAHQLQDGLLTLVPEPVIPAPEQYFAPFQQALTAALCASETTRPGTYSAGVELWFGADGKVAEVLLTVPSNNQKRDDALRTQLLEAKLPIVHSGTALSLEFTIEPTRAGQNPICGRTMP
jgi:hypothetical protein